MLKQDILKLTTSLKQYRRPRQFQTQFPNIILLPSQSTTSLSQLPQKFNKKFPNLSYRKQMAPYNYSDGSVITMTNITITRSQKDISGVNGLQLGEQEEEINKEDQNFWRKHYGNLNKLPIIQTQQQIRRIVQCFKAFQILNRTKYQQQQSQQNQYQNTNNNQNTNTYINTKIRKSLPQPKKLSQQIKRLQNSSIYDKLYQIYVEKGGDKTYEQLKQKIQSDVLALVGRQVRKRKR